MRVLFSMIALFAMSTVMSAQQASCTITSDGESMTRVYDAIPRVINNGDSVTIVNRRTGEVLDNILIEGSRFNVRCSGLRRGTSANQQTVSTTPTTPTTPTSPTVSSPTVSSPTVVSTPTGSGSSTRRGFPASAALGLPN